MYDGISSVDLFFSILFYINYGILTQFFYSIFIFFYLKRVHLTVDSSFWQNINKLWTTKDHPQVQMLSTVTLFWVLL